MLCPSCKDTQNKVIDSRLTEAGVAIRRRRECLVCGRRFTTKERVEQELRLMVVKSNGQRLPYRREEILQSLQYACFKLDVPEEQLDAIADRVEEDLFSYHDREVDAEQIGRYVGQHLRRVNQVAYVRFASVHRNFRTVEEFIDEIRDVQEQVKQDDPSQQPLFTV
ncbi:MAG: transcriptional repressor NrdR [Phycisphaerae bacterium]|nr:transcriptional repressor NrdR [Phycisphaerae bacterium]